jgi:hypothetical protein
LTPPLLLFVVGVAAPIAFDIQLEDRRVMNEAVYGGDGHAGVRKHVIPAREGLIGRYEKTFSFISLGDQLKQHTRLSLVLSDVRQIVQDDQIEAIELGECRRQLQALSRYLKLLHQLTGAGAQNPIARVDKSVSDGASKMTFSPARRTRNTLPIIIAMTSLSAIRFTPASVSALMSLE